MWYDVVSCYVMSYLMVLYHVMAYHLMLYHVMLYDFICDVMSCHIRWCHVCHVMSCVIMWCHPAMTFSLSFIFGPNNFFHSFFCNQHFTMPPTPPPRSNIHPQDMWWIQGVDGMPPTHYHLACFSLTIFIWGIYMLDHPPWKSWIHLCKTPF